MDGPGHATALISSESELRELLGEPLPRTRAKTRDRLHPLHHAWLAASPFCLVATAGPDGTCDVSPKGDPPGSLVHVIDERTLALAERPGNRRADGFVNLLARPGIGLIFVVPGRGDTLRINGRARLLREAPYAEHLAVRGRQPVLLCEVEIDEVFFHCSKAFLRSQLWDASTWDPDAVADRSTIAHALERSDEPLEQVRAYYESPAYGTDLY